MTVPVALLIYNRPDHTRRVLERVADYKPRRLLVVADGPKAERDIEACMAARAVIDHVTWDCEILTNYSDVNLGCKVRVSSGLDWVFSLCEEAIILEDDCVPNASFFPFCEQLLDRYGHDDRVMTISGCNLQGGHVRGDGSYYFSRYPTCWGWASWRRAWEHYDVSMDAWTVLRDSPWLGGLVDSEAEVSYWRDIFDQTARGEVDTWDYQWVFACWSKGSMAVVPNVNLVSNVGFGDRATHTIDPFSPLARLPTIDVVFPLEHPSKVRSDVGADDWIFRTGFSPANSRNERGLRRFDPRAVAAKIISTVVRGGAMP